LPDLSLFDSIIPCLGPAHNGGMTHFNSNKKTVLRTVYL
jgi:hypothetical protein